MTAQMLADACEEIGLPIPRNVIANWESGRRTTVTLPEILVLAKALDVAPAQLVFPLGPTDEVDRLPGDSTERWRAFSWFTGEDDEPLGGWKLRLYRQHHQAAQRIDEEHPDAVQLQFHFSREDWPLRAAEKFDRLVAATRSSLLPIRAHMRLQGLTPPSLHLHLAFLDEELPPLDTTLEDEE